MRVDVTVHSPDAASFGCPAALSEEADFQPKGRAKRMPKTLSEPESESRPRGRPRKVSMRKTGQARVGSCYVCVYRHRGNETDEILSSFPMTDTEKTLNHVLRKLNGVWQETQSGGSVSRWRDWYKVSIPWGKDLEYVRTQFRLGKLSRGNTVEGPFWDYVRRASPIGQGNGTPMPRHSPAAVLRRKFRELGPLQGEERILLSRIYGDMNAGSPEWVEDDYPESWVWGLDLWERLCGLWRDFPLVYNHVETEWARNANSEPGLYDSHVICHWAEMTRLVKAWIELRIGRMPSFTGPKKPQKWHGHKASKGMPELQKEMSRKAQSSGSLPDNYSDAAPNWKGMSYPAEYKEPNLAWCMDDMTGQGDGI